MKGMKESCSEELATHAGPESCVPAREGRRVLKKHVGIEALTGGSMGRVLSRETGNWGGRRHAESGRPHRDAKGVQTPGLANRLPRGRRPRARVDSSHRELGDLMSDPGGMAPEVRVANPRGVPR